VDSISSASIDVLSQASPYEEERTEVSAGLDFLYADTLISTGFTSSDESDYQADTAWFNVSQEVFGGLTTISMGFARGWDVVGNVTDPDFSEDIDRRSWRLGFSQVLTKNFLLGLNFEAITDEGFLNNPYRSYRYLDSTTVDGYNWAAEKYPNTRTSNATAIRGRYFLGYRASVDAGYRYFSDTWGIAAHNADIGYTHPLASGWIFELRYRYYTQTGADFYSDLFSRRDAQNFMGRDKELSTFEDHSVRFGVSYEFLDGQWKFLESGRVNLYYDRMFFDYTDFSNVLEGGPPGQEPLYSFTADIWQLFVSFWF